MLRKLRLKFVVINMAIVTAMLCVIFGLVYHSTRVDLEQENLNMARTAPSSAGNIDSAKKLRREFDKA